MEQYKRDIEKAVRKFRKDVQKIEESSDPRYKDQAFKDEAIREKRQELEDVVADRNTKYAQEAEALLEQRKQEAAKSYFKPSPSDKQFVESVLDEFTASVAFAYSDKQRREVFNSLEDRFEHMSPEQLNEVRKQLPKVLQSVNDEETIKKLRYVNSYLSNLQTPEQEALEEAQEAAMLKPDAAFRRLTFTHPAFKDQAKNIHNGTRKSI
ncbi:hypothetical protein [Halobacillus sp. K22]|uniref:hypothetical protein n=1 Tax=Halobacillus sp. K22 TaxID=3457431 RepID=UPI003FCC85DD